jgi:hypothetical protein
MLKAKLHSIEPTSVKATEQTILELIGMSEHLSCVFVRKEPDSDELVIDDDGWAEMHFMPSEGLLLFSCVRQGYVADMAKVDEVS